MSSSTTTSLHRPSSSSSCSMIFTKTWNAQPAQRRRSVWMCLIFGFTTIAVYIVRSDFNVTTSNPVGGSMRTKNSSSSSSNKKNKNVQVTESQRVQWRQQIQTIHQRVTVERESYIERLKREEYGTQYYPLMFQITNNNTNQLESVGRHLFGSFDSELRITNSTTTTTADGTPLQRAKRKLIMKLLQVLLLQSPHDSNNKSSQSKRQRQGERQQQEEAADTSAATVPFVIALGGNSVAAGHGNLYRESYTAVMVSNIQTAMTMAHFTLQPRPYASSAMQSAPESAFCYDALYGTDVDIMIWDFSLTDGKRGDSDLNKIEWFCTRSALMKKSKIVLAFNIHDDAGRIATIERLVQRGLTVLYTRDTILQRAEDAIPESMGLSTLEIDALPHSIRKYKCGNGRIESGEPLCGNLDKFNPICPNRPYMTNWHPGWKWNALMGNLLSHFVLDLLDAAIQDVISLTQQPDIDLRHYLSLLEAEEKAEFTQFWQTNHSKSLQAIVYNETLRHDIDWDMLASAPVYCRLAVLPSETRRKGIALGDTSQQLDIFSHDTTAISREEADEATKNDKSGDNSMRIVYESIDRDPNRVGCNETIHIDYKEFFYVNYDDGWKSLTVPNDEEIKEYGIGMTPKRAMVTICLKMCNWFTCPPGHLNLDAIMGGNATIEINRQRVSQMTLFHTIGVDCFLTGHDHGRYYEANSMGRFEFRARTKYPGMFLRFTSFIVSYDEGAVS